MASAELSRRAEKVVGYPPLSELSERQRRGFHELLLEAATFGDLPGVVTMGRPLPTEGKWLPGEAEARTA